VIALRHRLLTSGFYLYLLFPQGELFTEWDLDDDGKLSALEVRGFQFPDETDTRTNLEQAEQVSGLQV
jgi:hypothetical protein